MVRASRAPARVRGFTLFEVLIVMAIIAILASFSFGLARSLKRQEFEAQTRAELLTLRNALEQYRAEVGYYPAPGHPDDADPNLDGRLFRALFRTGRNAQGPLGTWEPTQLGVRDGDGYRPASLDEQNEAAKVVFLDLHGRPYHYREREARATCASRVSRYELWSEGMDGVDDEGGGDDIVERK